MKIYTYRTIFVAAATCLIAGRVPADLAAPTVTSGGAIVQPQMPSTGGLASALGQPFVGISSNSGGTLQSGIIHAGGADDGSVDPLVVTTTADTVNALDGERSLREAMAYANSKSGADTISFNLPGAGPHTIQLTSALPNLSDDATIQGPTSESVIVRGEGNSEHYRIFTIAVGKIVSISNLTMTNGYAGGSGNGAWGGGILNDHGTLTLTGCTLNGNTATSGGAVANDGVNGSASLNLVNCTLSSNTATSGGGIVNDGGGGGSADLTLLNCTLSGNSATDGASISSDANNGVATVHLKNTILQKAASGANLENKNSSVITSDGYNLCDDNAGGDGSPGPGGLLNGAGDIRNTDPKLAPLANNGGSTQTHALLAGSPGIDTGNTTLTADQRGISRPQGSADDIGAYEARQFSVSGLVRTSNLTPISGAAVTLTTYPGGTTADTATTAGNGSYSFSNVAEGYYQVSAGKSGFTFSPTSQGLRVSNANRGANFIGTANPPVYIISGRLSNSSGVAISNVSVALSVTSGTLPTGTGSPLTTNSAGYYTFTNVPNGSYTVTPTKSGYFFTPASKNVTVNGANLSGQNFIGSTGYTVSGRIATSSGIGITGATVTIDGGATATTNSAGYYTFTNVANGSHTVVPAKSGYTFVPAQKTVTVNGANLSRLNFTGS